MQAQFAPVNAILAEDVNNDGFKDILLAGNEYDYDAMTGSADASYGCVLMNDGKNNFKPVNIAESGFIIDGEVKRLKRIRTFNNKEIIIVALNNDKLKVFRKTFNK
jgi:hypothetical protein